LNDAHKRSSETDTLHTMNDETSTSSYSINSNISYQIAIGGDGMYVPDINRIEFDIVTQFKFDELCKLIEHQMRFVTTLQLDRFYIGPLCINVKPLLYLHVEGTDIRVRIFNSAHEEKSIRLLAHHIMTLTVYKCTNCDGKVVYTGKHCTKCKNGL